MAGETYGRPSRSRSLLPEIRLYGAGYDANSVELENPSEARNSGPLRSARPTSVYEWSVPAHLMIAGQMTEKYSRMVLLFHLVL